MSNQHPAAPLGLNAVGKPYGANYDPHYRMKFKPRTGHLRGPYPSTMKFIGDPEPAEDIKRKYARARMPRLKPAPLLAELEPSPEEMRLDHRYRMLRRAEADLQKMLRRIEAALQGLKAQLCHGETQ
jgi:hypothetical protein